MNFDMVHKVAVNVESPRALWKWTLKSRQTKMLSIMSLKVIGCSGKVRASLPRAVEFGHIRRTGRGLGEDWERTGKGKRDGG